MENTYNLYKRIAKLETLVENGQGFYPSEILDLQWTMESLERIIKISKENNQPLR